MINNRIYTGSQAVRPLQKYSFEPPAKNISTASSKVILSCNGQEFSCSRSLLSEASPVFEAMFGTKFEEARTGRANLDTIDADIMESILTFISTKNIPEQEDVDVGYWCSLLEASHLLQMTDLCNSCVRNVSNGINEDNFLTPWTIAYFCDYAGFAAKIRTVVANNFDKIIGTEDFLLLNSDQLKEVIVHPELIVSSMDVLVSVIFKWIEFDHDNRTSHLMDFLDLVDLSALSKSYLSNVICHPLVKRNYRARSRFFAAVSGLKHSKSSCVRPTSKRKPARLYCFGSKKEKQILATYDLSNQQWLPVQDVPFTVTAGMVTAFCGNRIYLAGGWEPDDTTKLSSKMYIYYPDSKVLSETRLLKTVSQAGAGVLHGSVYIVNGINEKKEPLKTVQQYDPIKGVCKPVVPTNEGHVRPLVAAYADYLYVIGSCDDAQKSLERYDSYMLQWTTITSIPGPIDWCHATLCRHELYVVSSVCEGFFHVYDLRERTWREVEFGEPCPCRVWGLWSAYFQKEEAYKLIARDRGHVIQFYNVYTGKWEENVEPNENLWYNPQSVVAPEC